MKSFMLHYCIMKSLLSEEVSEMVCPRPDAWIVICADPYGCHPAAWWLAWLTLAAFVARRWKK